jgi:hypothetical protein
VKVTEENWKPIKIISGALQQKVAEGGHSENTRRLAEVTEVALNLITNLFASNLLRDDP